MRYIVVAVLLLVGGALTSCTSSATQQPPSGSPSAADSAKGTGTIDPATLALSYRIQGGGSFVQGSRDLCDLFPGETILIEDAKETANFDGTQAFSSMSLVDGQIQYQTAWPQDVVGTGPTGGSGTYVVNADPSGKPVSITGHAIVAWHDKRANSDSSKPDDVKLTLTEIPRPDYCQPVG